MSALAILACVGVSLTALAALAATDPKRRRAFRLPALPAAPDRRLLWGAALAPGIAAALLGGGGGLVLWFGAATAAGWGLAALSPARTEGLAEWLGAMAARRANRPAGGVRLSGRRSALERRVAELEAEVAALRRRLAPEEQATAQLAPPTDAEIVEAAPRRLGGRLA